MNLNGTEKSAILLMTLGEKCAAKVFKHLSSREIEKLSCTMTTMTSINQLSHQQLLDILGEFADDVEMHAARSGPPAFWKTFSDRVKPPVVWKRSTLWSRKVRRI